MAAELVAAGVAANPRAIGLTLDEQALVAAAVSQFQLAGAIVLVVLELAAVSLVVLLQRALAIASAVFERTSVVAAGSGEVAQALEQPFAELAAVHLAIAAVPFALAVPLAILEGAGVPAAVGVVDASFTLQQAIDHLATVAAAIGQACVRWRQRFAFATGGEQHDQGEGSSERMVESGRTMR